MKKWIFVGAVAFLAVVVPLVLAEGKKPSIVQQPGGKVSNLPLEEGRSYFFAYEFSGDIRTLNASTPGSVEGEYLGEQRGNWVKVRQTRGDEKPTVFWVNLDRVAVIKVWPLVGESILPAIKAPRHKPKRKTGTA